LIFLCWACGVFFVHRPPHHRSAVFMKTLLRYYDAWLRPDAPWKGLALALVLKSLITGMVLLHLGNSGLSGYWGGLGGDTESYLEPVDHLLETGGYAPNHRLPGYGIPYLAFRQMMPRAQACNALLLFQLFMDALAVFLLARIVFEWTGSTLAYRAAFWLYGSSTFVTVYDVMILTESLTTSLLVLGVYFIIQGVGRKNVWSILGAGVAICWAAFMRPVVLPLFFVVLVVLLIQPHFQRRTKAVMAAFFITPLVLSSAMWIFHLDRAGSEWNKPGGTYLMPDYVNSPHYPIGRLVAAFGGNLTWWYPDAEIRAFNIHDLHETPDLTNSQPAIPSYAATPSFPMDSLNAVADLVSTWYVAPDSAQKKTIVIAITERSDRYIKAYSHENPWQYQVLARIRLLGKFILHNGASMPHHGSNSVLGIAERTISLILYAFTMILGCLGLVLFAFVKHRQSWPWLIPMIFGYGLLVHPLLMRFCEYRYLVPFYPFAIALATWCLVTLIARTRPH
jgi:hypothetical protein